MWGRGSPLAAAHCHSPLKKRGYLGVPYCFNTSRYFWCGKLFLLPKKILHLFLSIQISVIWNLNSYLGHFFFSPKAVFLADMEVLDKLISWKQFIAVNWATPFPPLYSAYSMASGKLLTNNYAKKYKQILLTVSHRFANP